MTDCKGRRNAVVLLTFRFLILAIFVGCLQVGVYDSGLAQDAPIPVRVAKPEPGSVLFQTTIDPSGGAIPGGEAAYQVDVRTEITGRCFGAPARPVDAVVLIDTSASAGIPGSGSNLFRSEEIVRSLWAQIDQPVYRSGDDSNPMRSRLGLVTVDIGVSLPVVNLRLPLTNTTAAIDVEVGNLNTGADSSFDTGINAASQYLLDEGRPDVERVLVIILHDSFFALQDEVIAAAQRAIGNGLSVFLIGNRLNIPEREQIDVNQALAMTSLPEYVFFDPKASDLRSLFVLASGSDETVAARGLIVSSEIAPIGSARVMAESVDGELISDSAARWRSALLRTGESLQKGLRFRISSDAAGLVGVVTLIMGLDCNGFPFQIGGEAQSTTVAPATPTPSESKPTGEFATPQGDSPPTTDTVPRFLVGGVVRWLISGISLGPIAVPWWFLFLLLLVFLLAVLRWIFRKEPVQSRTVEPAKPVSSGHSPKIESEQKTANTNLPGDSEDRAAQLRIDLSKPKEIRGRIPVGVTGPNRPKLAAKWLTKQQDMMSELPLGRYGKIFQWEVGPNWQEISISLLLEVVGSRLSEGTPMLAVYTASPGDHAEISTRIDETPDAFIAHCTRRYQAATSASRPQFYWLDLCFVDNPAKKNLRIEPIVET